MKTLVAALLLLATPVLGDVQGQGREPVSRAASRVNWTSASALNALFKDKASVKRFLNEIANGGDTSAPEFIAELYDHRFVDLNGDGWFELVALVGGQRLSTALEVVFQTPGGAPPADRLATTHDGFVMRELPGFDVGDLNAVLRDLDHDGTYKIVMPQLLGGFEGAARPQATIPEVFSWNGGDYAKVSARYPEFYRDEVLPRIERQLQMLEALPAAGDAVDRANRRAQREKYAREIAEARKRVPQK
jgi:hypothetical protein